jgi:hypothetical protein
MRVLMISIGSWGDVEPYVALSQELLKRNHSVDLFLQPQYHSRVEQEDDPNKKKKKNHHHHHCRSIQVHALPFNQSDFYKAIPKQQHHQLVDPKLKHVETVGEIIGQLVLPCLNEIYPVASNCHVMISSALARPLCILMAKALNINTILLHLQPLAPNRIFPSYRVSKDKCIQAILDYETVDNKEQQQQQDASAVEKEREETYCKIDQPLEEVFLKERLENAYEKLNLVPPTWSELQKILLGYNAQFSIVNAYSNHLIPAIGNTIGVGPHVHDIGPLADDYIPPNFVPDPSLVAFLAEWSSPICIGFGSMPFHRLDALMDALMQLDQPTILVGAPFQFRSCPPKYQQFIHSKNNKIHRVAFLPYAYLLPRCSMMLCHGGAGVVHACLRAGIPCLVSPIMGDQFFFASLLERKRLGVQCGTKLSELTKENVIQAIQLAQNDSVMKANCRRIRKELFVSDNRGGEKQEEYGVPRMADLLEKIHSKNMITA